MFSENNVTALSQFWVKDEGICTEVAFVTQNQVYLWNQAVWSHSYYRVFVETRVWPIDWWQIWWPRVNFNLLFRGANFSTTGISHTLSERSELWPRCLSGQLKLISRIWWTLVQSSHDTMRWHASVLHMLVKFFFTTSPCFPIDLVFILFTELPED